MTTNNTNITISIPSADVLHQPVTIVDVGRRGVDVFYVEQTDMYYIAELDFEAASPDLILEQGNWRSPYRFFDDVPPMADADEAISMRREVEQHHDEFDAQVARMDARQLQQ